MTDHKPERRDADQRQVPDESPLIYASRELFRGRREVWIEHGETMYRLRVTAAGNLYLTK